MGQHRQVQRAIPPKLKLYSEARHVSPAMTTDVHPVSQPCYRNSIGTLFSSVERRAHCRVMMLYHICSGLVAIPASIYLQPTVVHTRGFETSYRQIQCSISMGNQTFFLSAIRLWNTLPVDVCQLPPDSFKAQLNTVQLT